MAKTWKDIVDLVDVELRRWDARFERGVILARANECLGNIGETCRLRTKEWVSGTDFTLTDSDTTAVLPDDYISPIEILIGDFPVWRIGTTHQSMREPGYRKLLSSAATVWMINGNMVRFDGPCSDTVTVFGYAYLPELTDADGADNPLEYIPAPYQLLPADYVMSKAPLFDEIGAAVVARYAESYAKRFSQLVNSVRMRDSRSIVDAD